MGIFEELESEQKKDGYLNRRLPTFVGEQTGPVEDDIKLEFINIFKKYNYVKAAYLAILSYESPKELSVGLCIKSITDEIEIKMQEEIMRKFKSIFNSNTFLDIIIISKEQEYNLEKVCSPFYKTA